MRIAYTPEQERLRRELRGYFGALMTPEVRAALAGGDRAGGDRAEGDRAGGDGDYGDGQAYRQVVRQLGRDGWLALGWPEEHGGRGGTMLDQLIFTDEAAIARVPVPFLTVNTVGPTIMRFGTPAQQEFYLPRIAAGEIHFSIGYSEPEAGTDLASLRTTATRDGEDYVIDGQKMWTSLIQYANYVWLACRTDPHADRHKGLSIIIVPTSAEGFSWTPVCTVAGVTTSATYYSSVRVPATELVGEENRGWPLITNQLNHERVALTSAAPVMSALAEVRNWAASAKLASRAAGDRRRMGAAEPGPGAREGRVPQAGQLEDRVGRPRRGPGGGLGHQGVRHRVRGRGVPAADGGARRERAGPFGVGRGGAGRPDRAGAPGRAHPDLRRRHERDPARHHRGGRARAACLQEDLMDFTPNEAQDELAGLARKILAERDDPWADLAAAGVLAAGLPEAAGGSGLGLLEQCSVLIELGRAVVGGAVPCVDRARGGCGGGFRDA